MAWLYERALECRADQQVWWVAPTYKQAMIAYSRYRNIIPRDQFQEIKGEHAIVTLSGCKIVHRSAEDPDNLYGDDVAAVVIDEASRVREAAWHAVRSTL